MNNTPEAARGPAAIMTEIASCLCDAIGEINESYLKENPEDGHVDLASRLVLLLAKNGLTIVPTEHAVAIRVGHEKGAAAVRILDLFTHWLNEHPERHCITGFDRFSKLKFEIIMRESGETKAYFQGVSVQDAYGQAGQTLAMNEGEL